MQYCSFLISRTLPTNNKDAINIKCDILIIHFPCIMTVQKERPHREKCTIKRAREASTEKETDRAYQLTSHFFL